MIVETDAAGEEEAWVVNPCPGYVIKFREVNLASELFFDNKNSKLFLNICHCLELPPPIDDLEEDQVAAILDSEDPSRYRIPLSVGEIECIRDNKGENAAKVGQNFLFFP
ncbi:unnamed protein product [Toxocara canis]|uniref:PIH1 domain-containing protein n=1 Tax=Toxocara canis TaxID=6265 RepID=A0A183VBA1_TOXCA|nr:unnamed protein product [Toxocara canis]